MNPLAEQLVCLSQRGGAEDWGDVIILVVMAAFWLVGALAKLLAGKKTADRQHGKTGSGAKATAARETWQQRLARKARELQEAAQAEGSGGTLGAQTAKSRPGRSLASPRGQVSVRTDAKGNSVMVYERPEPIREQAMTPQGKAREAVLAAGQQILAEPLVTPQAAAVGHDEFGTPAASSQAAAAIEYGDPDALRRAILQYEILGKPLALRDPSEEATPF